MLTNCPQSPASVFLSAVRELFRGEPEIQFERGNPEPGLLFAERGDFGGFAIRWFGPESGKTAVSVQRFDSYEFGEPGWYIWDSVRVQDDWADGGAAFDLVWFAGLDATPETVAAVLIARFYA